MLIERLQKKWPEIRKIGQDAAERGKALSLKTDWQEERDAQRVEENSVEEPVQKRKA